MLVNNAGYGLVGAVEESSAAEVRDQFEVNVFGQLAMIRAVLPFMRARRAGRIVNITSVSGLATWAGTGVYCASKFALEAIGRTLAAEVAELGIKVINVAPGGMRTDYAGRSLVTTAQEFPDYDGVARQAKMMLTAHAGTGGRRPGSGRPRDPHRRSTRRNPPLNLLLGADALHYAEDEIARLQAEIEAWRAVSAVDRLSLPSRLLPGVVLRHLRVRTGLAPQHDLVAPGIAEGVVVAVEFLPVVIAPQLRRAAIDRPLRGCSS